MYDKKHGPLADWFKAEFSKRFNITNEGSLTWHLGVHYIRDREKRTTFCTQKRSVEALLEKYGYSDLKPRDTPMVAGEQLTKATDDELLDDAEATLFREMLGSIMYLATMTRPDLSYAAGSLAKFMQKPGRKHAEALKRVFRYISGTRDYGITFRSGDPTILVGYSDADWSNAETSKSVSGMVFTLHGAAVSWRAKSQSAISLSTAEAELMAAARAAQEA
eukprot:2669875-Rhodomonas_salina.1